MSEMLKNPFHPYFRVVLPALAAALLALSAPAQAESGPTDAPTGHITIQQMQVAFIASGNFGGGTLTFGGRSYRFKIGGLGVGGVGASRLKASGDVYGLKKISDFPGVYGAVRTGWAAGDAGRGRMWLRNANGVLLKLKGARQGLQLATGAEGVLISLQ
jgi:hypothetical protein